jgi:uncharacterized protein
MSDLTKRTIEYVKIKLQDEYTGHDWYHAERVWKLAKRLQEEEGGDKELIELSALLHDLGDYKKYEFNEIKGTFVLRGMMDVLEIEEEKKEKILQIIDEAQFIGDDTKPPTSVEAKIVQDADYLDALGAIGIARTFATGGKIGRMLHDPNRKPRVRLSKKDYQTKKKAGTSINYFYEKSLKLPKMMNTKTGKELAQGRVECMKDFLEKFYKEWEGKL